MAQSIVSPYPKTSTIVPLPKKPHISSFNDYRPMALTPVASALINWSTITSQQPYTAARTPTSMPTEHIDPQKTAATPLYAMLLHLGAMCRFVDYSAAFNTTFPHKLRDLGLPHSTDMWINSVIADRELELDITHLWCHVSVPAPSRAC